MRTGIVSALAYVTLALQAAPSVCHGAVTPAPLPPSARCVYRALKSSPNILSVNVYEIDDSRLGFEYAFIGTDGQQTASYIELVDGAFLGDKIPKEVSEQAMTEGARIESGLHLSEKCHLQAAFDNLFPQPPARDDWRRIYPPESR